MTGAVSVGSLLAARDASDLNPDLLAGAECLDRWLEQLADRDVKKDREAGEP